jgi:hypothetical protein
MTTTTIFAQVPTWMITADGITATDLRVLAVLTTYTTGETGRLVWPALATVAAQAHVSRASVKRSMKNLVQAGMIRPAGHGNQSGVRRWELAWDAPFKVAADADDAHAGGFTHDPGGSPMTPPQMTQGGFTSDPGGVHPRPGGGSPMTPDLYKELHKELNQEPHHTRARADEPQQPTPTLQSVVGIDPEEDLKSEKPKAKSAPAEVTAAPRDLATAILDAITETLTDGRPLTDDEYADVVRVIRRYVSEAPTAHREELEHLARSWAKAWIDRRLTSAGGSLSWTLRAGRLPVSEKSAVPNTSDGRPLPGYRDTPWGPEGIIDLRTGKLAPADYDWGDPDEDFLAEMKSLRLTRIDL